MKHLKLYEKYSSIEDIKSLFYDLEDEGFTVDIDDSHEDEDGEECDDLRIFIKRLKNNDGCLYPIKFKISDVEETIRFAYSYIINETQYKHFRCARAQKNERSISIDNVHTQGLIKFPRTIEELYTIEDDIITVSLSFR